MRALACLAAVLSLSALSGCTIRLSKDEAGEIPKNECSTDSDCGDGTCNSGMCVAYEGSLETLLLAITPPTDVSGVGGARFLQIGTDLSRTNVDYTVEIHRLSTVSGYVCAYDATKCSFGAGGTVPVEVTLTPHESSYGLPSISYVARTKETASTQAACHDVPASEGTAIQEFTVDVPPGSYDLYVRPAIEDGAPVPDGCVLAPELFRDIQVTEDKNQLLPLPLAAPQTFAVQIQWSSGSGLANLDGWTLEMVHPISGHRISDQFVLAGDPEVTADGSVYSVELHYSADDALAGGKELVRLSPPDGLTAPVLQWERSGLEATSPARTPALGVLPQPVALESWVWRADDFSADRETPVPATVTFTARSVAGITPGIVASYAEAVEVEEDGQLQATLLPGTYRVEAVPRHGLGLAAMETEITIDCERDPQARDRCAPALAGASPVHQAGRVFLVPPAAVMTGTVVEPLHHNRVNDATVQALPAVLGTPRCDTTVDPQCQDRPLHLFDALLGEETFVPRAVSAVTSGGKFQFDEVDCGACTDGNGALFDVSVRPPEGSRLPWFVRSDIEVDGGAVDLGELGLTLPIVQRGVVDIRRPRAEPLVVPRALIRAYALRDEQGQPIANPEGLSSCANPSGSSKQSSGAAHCIRSVIQVAEARSDDDGAFELVLPSSLE